MGDNRTRSDDGRDWGVVPRADMIGAAAAVYWHPRSWTSQ
jgi:hypothetical protein